MRAAPNNAGPTAGSQATEAAGPGLYDRALIWLISELGYWIIGILGRSVRWEVEGWEHYESIAAAGKLPVIAFWHDGILSATYYFRKRRIQVMTSRSREGDYIARTIQRFGYGAVRGSATRGGRSALVQMIRLIRAGCPLGFAIDGPLGPRHVAKPGAVWIASRTGHPVLPMNVALRSAWRLHTWDRFQIPKPFTRGRVMLSQPLYPPPDAAEEQLESAQRELQSALDDLSRRGDQAFG